MRSFFQRRIGGIQGFRQVCSGLHVFGDVLNLFIDRVNLPTSGFYRGIDRLFLFFDFGNDYFSGNSVFAVDLFGNGIERLNSRIRFVEQGISLLIWSVVC
ncbi:hypothetical protein SDC9_212509 [bioreactor metagenome]|uniref:Uncharacterized protein n=1 Tax=bioreactor metagenome TaxID=1076179 RepID=A0A645JN70_9ZZZZ